MKLDLQQLSLSLLPTVDVRELITRCIEEDGGMGGDVTTRSIIEPDTHGKFALHVRGSGIIAGLEPLSRAMDVFDGLQLQLVHRDGDRVRDEIIATLQGPLYSVFVAERTLLNILGHASGIATTTRNFVDAIAQTKCVVFDTRKTTPGLRQLDKYAVVCGGGTSHRLGLHDAALYKDNHQAGLADFSAQLNDAIIKVKTDHQVRFVEIEVDSLEQLEKVLMMPVDIVLLDNMSPSQLKEAVAMRDNATLQPVLEASGGITLDTVLDIAQSGVDRVAIGALTHHSHWLDIGLDAIDV